MTDTIACVGPPPPPEVLEVSHFAVHLDWEGFLNELKERFKDNGAIKVKVERMEGNNGTWHQIYKGLAKQSKFTDHEPKTNYQFRVQYEQKDCVTEFSPPLAVTTNREPLYAKNLHMAIKKMNLEELEMVLQSGEVSPDVQNEDSMTALMAAAKKPFLEGLEMLLEYGADVNFKNPSGKTALMIACTSNQLDSVRILRKYGADYTIMDNGGCCAIHWAVDARSVKLIDWIGEDGADLNIKDHGQGGWTPLIRCANMHGDRDVGLALMMNGADINGTDHTGSTALHHAVMRKHYDLCKVLLQRRADPLIQNKEHTTPWQISSSSDDRRRIAQLMEPYVEKIKAERKLLAVNQAAKESAAQAALNKASSANLLAKVNSTNNNKAGASSVAVS